MADIYICTIHNLALICIKIKRMIYQIDVNQGKNKQFLQMVELMTDLGVIQSISPENATPYNDTSLSDEELLEIIEASEKDFENGNTYTMEEVRQIAESWKNR